MKLFSQTREQLFTQSKYPFSVNFCSVLILLAAAFGACAQTVTFAWDPINGVAGYKLYQGGASRVYTNSVNAGSATQATVSGLIVGRTYYFAATAYNSSGIESDYSSEIVYTVPTTGTPVITLTSPTNGATYSSPATIHLAANVVANGHTVTKVQFLSNGTLANEVGIAPFVTDLGNISAGVYSYSARLVYDGGLTVDTPAVGVTVTSGRPPPAHPLNFAADSGTLSAPFVALNGVVSQNLLTTLVGSGEAVYNFTIDLPGNYVVSGSLNAPSDGENSLYINVDAQPTGSLMIWDIPVTSGFTNLTASWRGISTAAGPPQFSPKVFTLSAGTHQLYVCGREPNVQLQSFAISPAGTLMRLTMLPGKKAGLTGLGQSGHKYEVQASRDLKTWTVLGNVTADSTGAFSYTDTNAPSFSNRSYRLRDMGIAPAAAFKRLTMLPGQTVSLSGLGQSGHEYEVQTSRDLKNWSVLGNLTADSTGAFSYTDAAASSHTYRYYRLRDTTP
jgi:Bacterial Ig domain